MGNFTSTIMRARLHPPQRIENAQAGDAGTRPSNEGNASNGNAAATTTRNDTPESTANTESDASTGQRRRGSSRYNLRATPARQASASPSSTTTASVLGRRSRQEAFPDAGQEGTGIDARNRILQHLISQEAQDREQSDQPTIHFSFQYTDPESPSEATTVMVNVQLQNQQQETEQQGEDDGQRPTFMFNIYYLQPARASGDTTTAREQPSPPLEHIDQNRLLRQTFLNFYLIMHAANADRVMSYEELIRLQEQIGTVSTGLTPDQINSLQVRSLPGMPVSDPNFLSRCQICLEDWQREEQVRDLPCTHFFHVQCLDTWLGHRNSCPLCRQPAYTRRDK